MSSLHEHITGILTELANSPETALKELLESTHLSIDLLAAGTKLRPIQQFGLLEGLLFTRSEVKFFVRMTKWADQKQDLAKYCLQNCSLQEMVTKFENEDTQNVAALFFESGSTVAHCLGKFAEQLSIAQDQISLARESDRTTRRDDDQASQERPQLPVTVTTNNFTGLTSLAGLVDDLKPIQGRLSLKYFGFFPFADAERNSDWRIEGRSYNSLARNIQDCDIVFATCSTFSFLAGPIVGSRANCIAKRAMFSGAAAWDDEGVREFYLSLNFEKLVPIHMWNKDLAFEPPDVSCGCVFLQPKGIFSKAVDEWFGNMSEDDFSITDQKDFRETWHGRFKSLTADGRTGSTTIEIPIEKFSEQVVEHRVRIDYRLDHSWLEWLEHSIGMHILIALPRGIAVPALQFIEQDIIAANSIVERAQHDFAFVITNKDDALKQFVVDIEIKRK